MAAVPKASISRRDASLSPGVVLIWRGVRHGGLGAQMDIKGFVEKAKDAALAATEKAREVAASATEQAMVAMNTAAPPDQPGSDMARAFAALTTEKVSQLTELGTEKLQALIASFQQALPAIQMAGYELTEFEVELGVTPKLIPHFRHVPQSAEDVERARELVRDNKLGAIILSGLLKSGEVHKQIKVAGFAFAHIEIELGLIPSVRLQYKNDGSDAARPRAALPPPSGETTDGTADPASQP